MIWSHALRGALAAVAFSVILPAAAAAAPFNYTFDANGEGWTAVSGGPGQTFAYNSTGGNPGGFISAQQFINSGLGTGTLTLQLGVSRAISLSAADAGSTLSFDARLVNKDSAIYENALDFVAFTGSAGGTMFDFTLMLSGPLTPSFVTTSVTLGTASNWNFNMFMDPLSPRTATQADFANFLPFVTEMFVYTSYKIDRGTNGGLAVGFDNISLTAPAATPVPEPATLTLLGAGLASVIARRARRQR